MVERTINALKGFRAVATRLPQDGPVGGGVLVRDVEHTGTVWAFGLAEEVGDLQELAQLLQDVARALTTGKPDEPHTPTTRDR
ncbi:hypothetical protein [Streptomyces sp. NPDC089799]|uniref:hypothetical protein n=1 Tax=Streptomyces sp. NPDC089799 TaxID=3155066 RepID=UPI003419BAC1